MADVIRPEPFRRVDSEPNALTFERQVLESLDKLFRGQSELTVVFGQLAPRVAKLEQEAKWRSRAITIGKALAPFLAGLGAHYIPSLAQHVPGILDAIGALQ